MFPDRQRSFLDHRRRCRDSRAFRSPPGGRCTGTVSGRHPSPHRGSSVEFAEYRKYVPGDDLRRLDWRAYGRSDRFFVKEFEADTNLRCCLVLDTSGSMDFGSQGVTKIEYARRLAGATRAHRLAAGRRGRPVVRRQGDRPQHPAPAQPCAPHGGLSTFSKQAQPAGETQLAAVLHELAETDSPAALFVILSDLFIDPELLRACFQHMRFRKHDVAVFHLLDPRELDFDFRRPMRFLDMEGGPALFAEPNEIAARYHKALGGYLEAAHRFFSNRPSTIIA